MNKKPRVLIFTTAYLPFVGGAEIAVKEITGRLLDYDFDLITARLKSDLPFREKIGQINVYRIGFGFWGDKIFLSLFGGVFAWWLNHQQKYDLTWSIMASFGGLAGSVFKILKPEIPNLLTLQEGDDLNLIEKKVWLVWFWFESIFIKADYIQCISNYLKQWAEKITNSKNIPIEVVPNGVDIENFKPAKNKFILDHKLVVTTSRLVKKNGVDLLIKAMARLPQDVRLSIIGDGVERENLIMLTRELKLQDRVEFVGHLNQTDMITYLQHANVFVRASRSEGLGNSFLEAMAVGVPVVGVPVGGIVDFLVEGETGWLAWPEDMQSIADKINFIIDPKNKEHIFSVAERARKLVLEKYNWDKVTLHIKSIFDLLTK